MAKIICFDLEGPLSPQDNAYEVMGLFKDGLKVFEVISAYDDILTIEQRPGYEPGDTLSLIVPFLIYHGIKEEDIRRVSDTAKIVDGVPYTIKRLKEMHWEPHIISTSYQQHAYNIAGKIGVSGDKVYCTRLPLNKYSEVMKEMDETMMQEVESDILESLHPALGDEKKLKERLDAFFWKDLPKTGMGRALREVKVVGGQRKMDAAKEIARKADASLNEVIVVGDSITDYKMLREVRNAGGISVVFNGNRFSVPYANIGLASTDMRMLLVVVDAFDCGLKDAALERVGKWEKTGKELIKNPDRLTDEDAPGDVRAFLAEKKKDASFMPPAFHVLEGADEKKIEEVIRIHKEARSRVRGDAAKLG